MDGLFPSLKLAAVGVLVTACNPAGFVESAFPDRDQFAFRVDDDMVAKYLCEPGTSDAETLKRAQAAHRHFSTEFEKIVSGTVQSIMNSDASIAQLIGPALQEHVETLSEETEARYQCLVYDFVET